MTEGRNDFKTFLSSLAMIVLVCVFPFFVTNNYHNITISKFFFFNIASAFFLAVCVIARIMSSKNSLSSGIDKAIKNLSFTDCCMLMLLFVCIFSCLGCSDRSGAFSGEYGRRMGLVTMLGMGMAYFLMAKFYRIRNREFIIFGISVAVMCAFGCAQFMGNDPLGMLSTVASYQRKFFIAFIGNVDVYAGYLCIGVPFAMCMAVLSDKLIANIFWTVISGFGFIGFYTSNSDGAVLGFVASIAILFLISCKNARAFRNFWIVCAVFFFATAAFKGMYIKEYTYCRYVESLIFRPMHLDVYLPGLIISVVLAVLTSFLKPGRKLLKKFRIAAAIAMAIGGVGVLGAFIYFSFINTEADIGNLANYLRFNDRWGSWRGIAWKKMFEAYMDFPLAKKLIGSGEDTIELVLRTKFGTSVIEGADANYDSAHCEPFQYLITIGFWGFLSYISAVASSVYSCLKSDSIIKKALMMSVLGYFIQSTVSITQPISTPLMFVFIGLTQSASQSFTCDKTNDVIKEDT